MRVLAGCSSSHTIPMAAWTNINATILLTIVFELITDALDEPLDSGSSCVVPSCYTHARTNLHEIEHVCCHEASMP
eukprot:8124350-Alexandrium_andersonii.AAC.1